MEDCGAVFTNSHIIHAKGLYECRMRKNAPSSYIDNLAALIQKCVELGGKVDFFKIRLKISMDLSMDLSGFIQNGFIHLHNPAQGVH